MADVTMESLMEVSLHNKGLLEWLVCRMRLLEEKMMAREDAVSSNLLPEEVASSSASSGCNEAVEDVKVKEEWASEEGMWNEDMEAETASLCPTESNYVNADGVEASSCDLPVNGQFQSQRIGGLPTLQEGTYPEEMALESIFVTEASTSGALENNMTMAGGELPSETCLPSRNSSWVSGGRVKRRKQAAGIESEYVKDHEVSWSTSDASNGGLSQKRKRKQQVKNCSEMQAVDANNENVNDEGFPEMNLGTSADFIAEVSSKWGGKKIHRCQLCPYQTEFKQNLTRHKIVHSGVQPHSCDVCKRKFGHKSSLQRHYEALHS